MNILIALLFVLFGCEKDIKPLWLSGTWKGTFKDTHTSIDTKIHFVDQPAYPAELKYMVSTNSGTVSYPTLSCTSNWVFLKTDNDTLFFEKKNLSDKNQLGCVDKMQYKLFQLSKNEIAVLGDGIAINGIRTETKGILTKFINPLRPYTAAQSQEKTQQTSVRNDKTDAKFSEAEQSTKFKYTPEKETSQPTKIERPINKLVGNWECINSESNCIFLWQLNANYTMKYSYDCKHGNGCNNHRWSINGNTFSEILPDREVEYEFEWIDNNSFSAIGTGGEMIFYRTQKQPNCEGGGGGGGGGADQQCGYCEGRGTVRCCDLGGFYKPDCLSQSVYINCMSNPTPCELRVTCCRCKGTGRY